MIWDSAMIPLGQPTPRAEPGTYSPIVWPAHRVLPLPRPSSDATRSVAETLAGRRSSRSFSSLPLQALGSLLWHSARTIERVPSPYGFELELRPSPSGGAIHPIHLIIWLPERGEWAWYSARAHRLHLLGAHAAALDRLLEAARTLLPDCSGTVIACVAEPGLTQAKYEHVDSVIWRDAGILQGTLGIVAASLDLQFCLLGLTGNPWVCSLADEGRLSGVGVAATGF
jgi:hypothetical protein